MVPTAPKDDRIPRPMLGAKPDPYGFALVNAKDTASHSVTRIFVSANADANELSLKFTNKQNAPVKLIGLNGSQMPASNQEAMDGPTALFLYFGPSATSGVFTPAQLAVIGIQATVEGQVESSTWTIKQYAGDANTGPYLGLCPNTKELSLASGASVVLRFTNVTCSFDVNKQVSSGLTLEHNLPINEEQKYKKYRSWSCAILPTGMPSPDLKDAKLDIRVLQPEVWITPETMEHANRKISNELTITVQNYGDVPLKPTFSVKFLHGDKPDYGLITRTAPELGNVHFTQPDGWAIEPLNDRKEWTIQPNANTAIAVDATVQFKFMDLVIPGGFEPGAGYVYVHYTIPGTEYRANLAPCAVNRAFRNPKIENFAANSPSVNYGKNVELTWASMAVPYLFLSMTDTTGTNWRLVTDTEMRAGNPDAHGVVSSGKMILGPLKEKATLNLYGYDSNVTDARGAPTGSPTQDLYGTQVVSGEKAVAVVHTAPQIKSVTAVCHQTTALVAWDVAFTEDSNYLQLTVFVDGTGHQVDRVGGKLPNETVIRNLTLTQKPKIALQAKNRLDNTNCADKTMCAEGDATVDFLKSATFTPDTPFVLGISERVRVDYEAECNTADRIMTIFARENVDQLKRSTDQQTEFKMESGRGSILLDISQPNPPDANHSPWVRLARKSDRYVGLYAAYKAESVEDYLVRKSDFHCCYRCNVDGYNYWFNECDFVTFFWESGQLKARYFMDIGANGYHGSWQFTSPVRFVNGYATLILNGPGDEQHFRGGTETGDGRPFDNGDFRVRNGAADVVFTLSPRGLELAGRPWQISWNADSWSYHWDVRVPWDQKPTSFFQGAR